MNNILNIIISPREALEAVREKSDWLLPLIIAIILGIAGYFLGRSESLHAQIGTMSHMLTTNSMFAGFSDTQKQKMIYDAGHPTTIKTIGSLVVFAFVIALYVIMNTLFLMLGSAVGGGDGTFKKLFSASALIGVPTLGIISVLGGLIMVLRGPESFATQRDILTVLPSLASFAQTAPGALFGFLAAIGIAGIWGLFLNFTALKSTARVSGPAAWIFPAVILLLQAGVGALFGIFS